MHKQKIILLHGALGSASQFDLLKSLLSEFYEVHAINFSGHGGASLSHSHFAIELFVNDIVSYMEQNNIKSSHFFGYSMGGYAAVKLASEKPHLVNSIITLATKFDWSAESALKEVAMLDCDRMAIKIPDYVNELKKRHSPLDWTIVVNKTAELIAFLGAHPLDEKDYNNVKCRIRLMSGDRDRMVNVDSTYNTFRKFENAELSILPATSHPFEMVNQERLVFEIRNFIN